MGKPRFKQRATENDKNILYFYFFGLHNYNITAFLLSYTLVIQDLEMEKRNTTTV